MRILLVSTMRNEGPFLLEWIAHHLGAGVTDFLIFTNDCDDGTEAILTRLAQAGVVTHLPQQVAPGESPQWQALRAAWHHPLRKACDWALVLDADEFLNIHAGDGTIPGLLAALPEGTEAMALPWRLFGHAGRMRFIDAPTTAQFTASAPPDCPYPIAATLFKTLFRLKGPFNQFGVHRPRQKTRDPLQVPVWVDGSGQPLPRGFATRPQRLSLLGISQGRAMAECNHYSLRSAESFMVKRARGLPNRSGKAVDLGYWVERNFNSVENHSIARMEPATARAMSGLRAIPGVIDAHDAACAHHRAKFLALMQDRDAHRLFAQIAVTGDSRVPDSDTIHQILGWYRGIITADPGQG